MRPLAWGMTAALVGTIAANVFYLTMSFYYFFAFALLVLAAPIVFARRAVKVVVLTTSYPRDEGDVAGLFVRDAVEGVRARGVEVEVVSPASFRHFGIAYGHGIAGNLRRRPWLALLLPAFLVSFARAARRAARDADLVHAHWLPSGLAALATRKPFVAAALGDGRRARAARAVARPADRAPGAARARRVECARRRPRGSSARARCA